MTTHPRNSNTPTRKLFEPTIINIEIKTAVLLEQFQQDQKKNGRAPETIRSRMQQLKQVAQLTNINDPEAVKTWLADENQCKWNNKTKTKFTDTYTAYLTYSGQKWQPPRYTPVTKLPFIPTEQEIDLLIAGCGKQTATVLQTLKETGMRIGELTQLKWINIDTERKTVNITPEKGSNPRILPISDKLLAMINKLPKKDRPTIFQPKKHILREYFSLQRKEIAEELQNPRIREITFHTLRHWKGTMEYHKTKDIMHVKYVLGHKSITSTLVYINLESALFLQTNDNFTCKVAKDLNEATQLVEAGFEYITEMDNVKLFRKRK